MIRRIVGFALLAIVVWLALKVAIGLAITVLIFTGLGYLFYIALRIFSPVTAAKVRDLIRGRSTRPIA